MEINNESDLLIEIQFYDEQGLPIDVPMYDFEFQYFVYPNKVATAKSINGMLKNCYVENNKLYATLKNPNFGDGKLKCKKIFYIPDKHFDSGIRKVVVVNDTQYNIL